MIRRLLVFAMVVFVVISSAFADGKSFDPTVLLRENPGEDRNEKHRNDCGAKSLYIFCRALGLEMTEEFVASRCQTQPSGMSMADVASAATKLGAPVEGVFANRSELLRLPTPLIALLEPDGMTGDVGHFVVVLDVTDEGVSLVDPRVRSLVKVPLAAFSRSSTGCYLIRSRRIRATVFGVVGLGCLLIGILWPIWRRLKCPRLIAPIVILLCAAGCGGSPKNAKPYVRQYVLKVDREHHDLGTVVVSEKKSVEFQFTNSGKASLNLDIANSCGCLEAKLTPPGALPAGQSAKLTVVIDMSSKPVGPFTETLVVRPREAPEERQLQIAGRIEGVWVKSNGFTVHLSDASLPAVEIGGFFDSKTPDAKFLDAVLELPGLEIDLQRVRSDRDASPFGFHFRWSMPVVAKVDQAQLKLGQYQGQIKMSVNGKEKLLRFPLNVLP